MNPANTPGASTRVALLLGAGFSASAGLPVMAKFGDRDYQQDRLNRIINRTSEEAKGNLDKAGKCFIEFQNYCNNANRFTPIDTNNLEQVFCIAESLKEAGVESVQLESGTTLVDDIYKYIQLWLWNIYQGLPDLFEKRKNTLPSYRKFVSSVAKLENQLTVITTNYDVLFEYISTCVVNARINYPWDARRLWVNRKNDSYHDPSGTGCLICKVHGSVNFFEGAGSLPDQERGLLDTNDKWFGVSVERAQKQDESLDEDDETTYQTKIKRWGGSRIPPNWAPYPAAIVLGAIWMLQQKYACIRPAIIPPTYAKLEQTPWLAKTWAAALNALSHARLLVIIGYSMPDSDGFMRAMIQAAMAQRDPNNPLKVYIVDPAPTSKRRYKRLFKPLGKSSLHIVKTKFEDWAKEGNVAYDQYVQLLNEAISP